MDPDSKTEPVDQYAAAGAKVPPFRGEEARAKTLRNQAESPLLRLPGELRNRIYEFALCVGTIYFIEGVTAHDGFGGSTIINVFRLTKPTGGLIRSLGPTYFRLLQLARTSHQIRAEAELLPFRLNTFNVHLASLRTFHDILSSEAFEAIETLELVVPDHTVPGREEWEISTCRHEMEPLEFMLGLKRIKLVTEPGQAPVMRGRGAALLYTLGFKFCKGVVVEEHIR